jgi:hypothetical protein
MTGPTFEPGTEPAPELGVFGADGLLDGTDLADAVPGAPPALLSMLDALRQPATSAELAGEDDVVSAMAGVLSAPTVPASSHRAEESDPKMWRKLLTTKAIAAAAGVLLMGGTAAAAAGYPPPLLRDALGGSTKAAEVEPTGTTGTTGTTSWTASTESTTTTGSPSAESTTETTTGPRNAAGEDGDTSATADEGAGRAPTSSTAPASADAAGAPTSPASASASASVVCEDGNHGATVSAAAHDRSGTPAEHAAGVVAAAHSDCGKPNGAGDAIRDASAVAGSGGAPSTADVVDATAVDQAPVDTGVDHGAGPGGNGQGKQAGGPPALGNGGGRGNGTAASTPGVGKGAGGR